MDIDIRLPTKVDRIIFGDNDIRLAKDHCPGLFSIVDCYEDNVLLHLADIPNLIKALQKAQEVWGEK